MKIWPEQTQGAEAETTVASPDGPLKATQISGTPVCCSLCPNQSHLLTHSLSFILLSILNKGCICFSLAQNCKATEERVSSLNGSK